MKKTLLFVIAIIIIISGCSTINVSKRIVETYYVFPDFSSMYVSKGLKLDDVSTVLVKPVFVENFPDKKATAFFSEIVVNNLTKMDIRAILMEEGKSLEYYKKKFNTSIVCDTKMLYEYVPSSTAGKETKQSNSFGMANSNLNVNGSQNSDYNLASGSGSGFAVGGSSSEGMFSSTGQYFKFKAATFKIKNIDKEKILFSDEIGQQDNENDAIKRMMGHLAICLSNKDVDTFKKIFLKTLDTTKRTETKDDTETPTTTK